MAENVCDLCLTAPLTSCQYTTHSVEALHRRRGQTVQLYINLSLCQPGCLLTYAVCLSVCLSVSVSILLCLFVLFVSVCLSALLSLLVYLYLSVLVCLFLLHAQPTLKDDCSNIITSSVPCATLIPTEVTCNNIIDSEDHCGYITRLKHNVCYCDARWH